MGLLLALVIVYLLAVGTAQKVSSADGLKECRTSQSLTALEVLPGGGWDNLRNLDRGRVMNTSYSQCKTTEDGAYFLPDQVYVVPLKRTSIETVSELIENWRTYKSSTSASVNAEVSFLSFLNGKFSMDSERVKTHQVRDSSMTTRTQVRNLIYQIKTYPNFQLDQGFKDRLIQIGNYMENNQTRAVSYYTQLLVLNYGTHVLTGVHAGANLVQEDQVRSSFVSDSWSRKSTITASAGATFFHTVNVGIDGNVETMAEFTRQYLGNRSHSMIESNGGIPFYPGMTLQKWQQEITNQLVAIDRSGQPLSFFVNPQTIPELPEPTVRKLAQAVDEAISLYYTVNTHPGCLDLHSPNFNFRANVDDGSCKDMGTNFTFGGIYQECTGLSGADARPLCEALEQKNPLTGSFSCPSEYTAIQLHTGVEEEAYSQYECQRRCHSCWAFFSCCKDVCGDAYYVRRAQFKAYWCAAMGPVTQSSGYLFGGLYSADAGNPLTQTRSCPPSFYPLNLFQDLKICVSDDYEMGLRYSVSFGGFFTCDVGNPLVQHSKAGLDTVMKTEPSAYPKKCPKGYSQHRAIISDGCQILYCVKSGAFDGFNLPRINLPPFSQLPLLTASATNTVVVLSQYQEPWLKDTQTKLWRTAHGSEVHELFSKSSSGGATAAISVTVTLALVALIAFACYGRKRWRNRGYHALERSSVISNAETEEHQDPSDSYPQGQNSGV
ncbi:macrophage-expressed gene 1 protein [Rhincodon typus]|uniref:macrophage-expressed gene 1 protein n=1 Tax=Rhincodon typus TaxID=259920 RepID=UPI0009A2ED14|nr:macrophage-expressed gene 1 protein [Rhincodon typus]